MLRVLSQREMEIADEDDVAEVRAFVRELAGRRNFDSYATAALVTATSELTRNTWIHGGGGKVQIEELIDDGHFGVRLEFVDQGPGIAELDRALAGGFSTGRSLGLGLSGSRRLVDEFEIESEVGKGTTVRIAKWKRL